jgi:hypothetical protein
MTDKPPIEPDPDAWKRFEHAVDAALHTAPKHRVAAVKSQKTKPKDDSK